MSPTTPGTNDRFMHHHTDADIATISQAVIAFETVARSMAIKRFLVHPGPASGGAAAATPALLAAAASGMPPEWAGLTKCGVIVARRGVKWLSYICVLCCAGRLSDCSYS